MILSLNGILDVGTLIDMVIYGHFAQLSCYSMHEPVSEMIFSSLEKQGFNKNMCELHKDGLMWENSSSE